MGRPKSIMLGEIVEMDEKPIAGIKGKKKIIHVNRSPVVEGGDCRCIAQLREYGMPDGRECH